MSNKVMKMDDEAMLGVAGGSNDNNATYKVGSVVEFKVTHPLGAGDEVLTGTIITARDQLYAIRSGAKTYTVKEKDILTPPPVEIGVYATESGAHGSW